MSDNITSFNEFNEKRHKISDVKKYREYLDAEKDDLVSNLYTVGSLSALFVFAGLAAKIFGGDGSLFGPVDPNLLYGAAAGVGIGNVAKIANNIREIANLKDIIQEIKSENKGNTKW